MDVRQSLAAPGIRHGCIVMSDRHAQVKRLFLAASELPPPERALFLAQACGGDLALRQELDELLLHHRPTTWMGAGIDAADTQPQAGTDRAEPADSRPTNAPPTNARISDQALTAGTILIGRYRIVDLLGRGGMGVVYRADDLELGQPVALKLLTAEMKDHPAAWETLRNEVRMARQISHEHVVRVHDLTLAENQILVSMEYVAGEDLDALLRRVGRLSPEKLHAVALELAEGLAAAHRVGVLHRDLKPSNVMLDRRGSVRILDFGIAAATTDVAATRRPAGTPGFIAPEVLAGQAPTVKSDLYSWGLVVRAAANGLRDLAETQPALEDFSLSPQAAMGHDVDDELNRVVQECLESNPDLRPASADEIVARLSQRDPLEDALAAGRVPSPAIVAAAHALRLKPGQRHAALGLGIVFIVLILLLADRTLFLPRCGLVKSPAVLADVSRQILTELGQEVRQQPHLTGITLDDEAYEYLVTSGEPNEVWDDVRAGQWPVVFYWQRAGDPRLPRWTPLGNPTPTRLPELGPNSAAVRLDGHGRLLTFATNVESLKAFAAPAAASPDWDKLFALAGLKRAEFVVDPPAHDSTGGVQNIIRWRGPHHAIPNEELVVHGLAANGQVVLFDLRQPWEVDGVPLAEPPANHWSVYAVAMRTTLWIVTFFCGLWLAWLNHIRALCDWKGARRLAALVGALVSIDWLIGAQHTFNFAEELSAAFGLLTFLVFTAVASAVLYLSVEPYARRHWPRMLTGWSRLFQGRWRDAAVGKELLLGAVVGFAWVVLLQLDTLIPAWFGLHPIRLKLPELGYDLCDFFALEYKGQVVVRAAIAALARGLLLSFLLLTIRFRCKSDGWSSALFVISATLLFAIPSQLDSATLGITYALIYAATALLVKRVGLLSIVAAWFVSLSILNSPVTLDREMWFAPSGFATIAAALLVLAVGWGVAGSGVGAPAIATRR
jgi:hypothetical protein